MNIEFRIPCSPDQADVIADHLFLGHSLGMQPDERAWIIAQVKKQHPSGKVTGAVLDLSGAEWVVSVTIGE